MAADLLELRLPVDLAPPEQVPHQLQNYISPEAWQARVRAVIRKGGRYIKPGFDMVWGIIAFIMVLALPIAMYFVALRVLPHEADDNVTFEVGPNFVVTDDANRIWKARGISIGTFFGVILLMWGPLFLWKLHGKSQVNKMLERFENEDRAVRPGAPVPIYRISRPTIGATALQLNISVPGTSAPTSFQTGSQPPSYIVNAPPDPATAYGTRFGQAPPVSGQGVPLYNQYDEKVPDYSGPPPGVYMPYDEKREFESLPV